MDAARSLFPEGVVDYAFGDLGTSPWHGAQPTVPRLAAHAVARWFRAVKARAGQILEPYSWAPSRHALRVALYSLVAAGEAGRAGHLPAVGRTAIRVAAASLPVAFGGRIIDGGCPGVSWWDRGSLPTLREARAALVAARGWAGLRRRWAHDPAIIAAAMALFRQEEISLATAEEEAVEALFDLAGLPTDEAGVIPGRVIGTRHGITIRRCWSPVWAEGQRGSDLLPARRREGPGNRYDYRTLVLVVGPGGRTYHTTGYEARGYHPGPYGDAIGAALQAWGKQRQADRRAACADERLEHLLHRVDGAETVVFFADSISAGNCPAGTAAWGKRHGYQYAAPLAAVVADSSNARAQRVVQEMLS